MKLLDMLFLIGQVASLMGLMWGAWLSGHRTLAPLAMNGMRVLGKVAAAFPSFHRAARV